MLDKIVIFMMWLIGLFVLFGPYLYHWYVSFVAEKYILLLVGGFIPPIGWVHGLGAFFGWWP